MTSQKIKMRIKNTDGDYVQVLPETIASQVVVDSKTGQTLEDLLLSGLCAKVSKQDFVTTVSGESQAEFEFNVPTYNAESTYVSVHVNGEFMHPGEEYSIVTTGTLPKVVLAEPIKTGDKIYISVEKNVLVIK